MALQSDLFDIVGGASHIVINKCLVLVSVFTLSNGNGIERCYVMAQCRRTSVRPFLTKCIRNKRPEPEAAFSADL